MVAGGEDLDGLSAAVAQGVEQAGMQALLEEDVSRDSGLHHLLRYSSDGSARLGCVFKGLDAAKCGAWARIGTQPKGVMGE